MTLRLGVLAWQVGRPANIAEYAATLNARVAEAVSSGAQLLLMPEYACTEIAAAFAARPDPAAELEAACDQAPALLHAMRACAVRHQICLLPGTLPVRRAEVIVNQAPLFTPDGRMAMQDKHVLTRFETELWSITPGRPPGVFSTPWGRIGIAICYDAEFPPLVRAQVEAGAWLILVPSCTDTMAGFNRVRLAARARALENQCYVAVAPTVGSAPWLATLDENRGYAVVFGPVDRGFPDDGVLARGGMDKPGWLFADLDSARLEVVRRDGAVRNHRDWPATPAPCPVLPFCP